MTEPAHQFHSLTADAAIGAFRRSVGLARTLRWVMITTAIVLLPLSAQFSITPFLVCAIFVPWIILEALSTRSNRLNRDATTLISLGAFEAAEEKTAEALKLFSLHRTVKLNSLHQLATIRHAQRRFVEASKLAREVVSDARAGDHRLDRSTRLVLVDSLIELNDLESAATELGKLSNEPLTLRETLTARQLHVELLGRRGVWTELMRELPLLIDLAELMQSLASARTHAWLALAARHSGQAAWSNLLRERAELLADVETIADNRPSLWQLWNNVRSSSPPALPDAT